jgi:nitrate/nitrite-specific signal transduction histidine kinase
LLGTWLASPIRKLRDTIERIRGGEQSLRAEVTGEDEVSFLAESFNELMDERDGDKAP